MNCNEPLPTIDDCSSMCLYDRFIEEWYFFYGLTEQIFPGLADIGDLVTHLSFFAFSHPLSYQ
jgi:hypothetical protein